jgi:caffeoyl-CoA O-methyltransferase
MSLNEVPDSIFDRNPELRAEDFIFSLMTYMDDLVPPRLSEMRTMEDYGLKTQFPIIGPAGGHFCYLIARMTGAKRIFELGSGYGYSTAWFAKAVKEQGGGVVHFVEMNRDLSEKAEKHLSKLGYDSIVEYHNADAVKTLQETEGPFDLIFCDIDKNEYGEALHIMLKKLRTGGILIVDNMFWSGLVLDTKDESPTTKSIRGFTKKIMCNEGLIASLLPVRDGMLLVFKK